MTAGRVVGVDGALITPALHGGFANLQGSSNLAGGKRFLQQIVSKIWRVRSISGLTLCQKAAFGWDRVNRILYGDKTLGPV